MSTVDRSARAKHTHRVPTANRAVGLAGIFLALLALASIWLGLPWSLRYSALVAAIAYGPAIPLLRACTPLSLLECLVYGIGTNVALAMLVSLGMVMAHLWAPLAASVFVLALSLIAGVLAMRSSTSPIRGGEE